MAFEWKGFTSPEQDDPQIEKKEQSSFLDFVEDNSDSKFAKKAKKALKATKKNVNKLKKLSSKQKELEKHVCTLEADMKQLKKSAYNNKIAELINCDSVTERKRLANDLLKMEVYI